MGKEDRYDFDDDSSGLGSDETEGPEPDVDPAPSTDDTASSATSTTEPSANLDEIPHRVRHDSPQAERTNLTMYVDSDRDIPRLDEFHSLAKSEFTESVHKNDVYLAAARAGFDNSADAFLEKMREIGYGYFD